MRAQKFAVSALMLVTLTGCAAQAPAAQAPAAESVAADDAKLPKSCQMSSILSYDTGFQAWDKTDPADEGKKLDCMFGIPNSDVGMTLNYEYMTSTDWQKYRKTALNDGWISDTITENRYSTIYLDANPEAGSDSVEVKVFVRGVVLDYMMWWNDKYDPNAVELLAGIDAIQLPN